MSKAKKLHKKKAKFNAFCVGRRRKVKQGQARRLVCGSLEREFIKRVAAGANSPEAARQIYAKRQGKFKPNSSQI
ncbi:hypothetical protein YZ62_003725 [Campylobacter upsaliensis]|nr:hypothetical protein [Campylobacter upsaliensis]MPB22259.1 hypothetical protein [Campylobacter upsaliensis]